MSKEKRNDKPHAQNSVALQRSVRRLERKAFEAGWEMGVTRVNDFHHGFERLSLNMADSWKLYKRKKSSPNDRADSPDKRI